MEKLIKKNAKLKGKLSAETCKCNLSQGSQVIQVPSTRDIGTMTSVQMDANNRSIDVDRLKIDRDFYHQEYLKLLNKPFAGSEINLLRRQLIEKDYEIKTLQKQFNSTQFVHDASMPCRAVESAVHRSEREKMILQNTVKQLTTQCEELREKLQINAATQRDQITRDEYEMEQLRQKIRQIDSENLNLKTIEATLKSTVAALRDETAQLKAKISELCEENIKLSTSSKHIRVLQEQTENALIEHQSRLTQCERQRDQAESRINFIDSSRSDEFREISELRAEICRLKASNTALAKEKDQLIVSTYYAHQYFNLSNDLINLFAVPVRCKD